MFSSVKKRIFDLVINKLNENTQSVTFDGNFMFKFFNGDRHNFEIVVRNENFLDFETQKIVPVVDAQNIQIPFLDRNDRDDFEREFYIAIEVPSSFDIDNRVKIEFQETNPTYQAILETIKNFKDTLSFVDGDYKYTFKVKEPTRVDYFKYNGIYYQLVAFTMNLTSLKKGYFGNETKVYLGLKSDINFGKTEEYELDIRDWIPTVAKETRPNANIGEVENTVMINKRTWFANSTVNFLGNTCDLLLQKELDGIVDSDLVYQVTVVKSSLGEDIGETYEYTRDVYVTTLDATYSKNSVDQITFKLERA